MQLSIARRKITPCAPRKPSATYRMQMPVANRSSWMLQRQTPQSLCTTTFHQTRPFSMRSTNAICRQPSSKTFCGKKQVQNYVTAHKKSHTLVNNSSTGSGKTAQSPRSFHTSFFSLKRSTKQIHVDNMFKKPPKVPESQPKEPKPPKQTRKLSENSLSMEQIKELIESEQPLMDESLSEAKDEYLESRKAFRDAKKYIIEGTRELKHDMPNFSLDIRGKRVNETSQKNLNKARRRNTRVFDENQDDEDEDEFTVGKSLDTDAPGEIEGWNLNNAFGQVASTLVFAAVLSRIGQLFPNQPITNHEVFKKHERTFLADYTIDVQTVTQDNGDGTLTQQFIAAQDTSRGIIPAKGLGISLLLLARVLPDTPSFQKYGNHTLPVAISASFQEMTLPHEMDVFQLLPPIRAFSRKDMDVFPSKRFVGMTFTFMYEEDYNLIPKYSDTEMVAVVQNVMEPAFTAIMQESTPIMKRLLKEANLGENKKAE